MAKTTAVIDSVSRASPALRVADTNQLSSQARLWLPRSIDWHSSPAHVLAPLV